MNNGNSKTLSISDGQEQAQKPSSNNSSEYPPEYEVDDRLLDLEHEIMQEVENDRTMHVLVKKIKKIHDVLEKERGNE